MVRISKCAFSPLFNLKYDAVYSFSTPSLLVLKGYATFQSHGLRVGSQRPWCNYYTGMGEIKGLFRCPDNVFYKMMHFFFCSFSHAVIKPIWKYGTPSCRQRKDKKLTHHLHHGGACWYVHHSPLLLLLKWFNSDVGFFYVSVVTCLHTHQWS